MFNWSKLIEKDCFIVRRFAWGSISSEALGSTQSAINTFCGDTEPLCRFAGISRHNSTCCRSWSTRLRRVYSTWPTSDKKLSSLRRHKCSLCIGNGAVSPPHSRLSCPRFRPLKHFAMKSTQSDSCQALTRETLLFTRRRPDPDNDLKNRKNQSQNHNELHSIALYWIN